MKEKLSKRPQIPYGIWYAFIFFCDGELMWCNGQASECLVGPHLSMPGIIFVAECSDWFGISSSIGVPYTVPFHCWHFRTGFEHRLSWFQSVRESWINGSYSLASCFCSSLHSYSVQKRGVDVRFVLSGLDKQRHF